MSRTLGALLLGTGVCLAGIAPAGADEPKAVIKGGIEGWVKKVDVDGKTLTITTNQGRERTFTVTEDTIMVGPNGGKVRKHLHDRRFHEGFPVTVVAEGTKAEEIHFGFAKDAIGGPGEHAKAAAPGTPPAGPTGAADRSKLSKGPAPVDAAEAAKRIARQKEAAKQEEEDEDEIPGHVKSFDATRRILVLTLFNGKDRSFVLPHDVPVHVQGAVAASRQGLMDPELKAGAFVTVVAEEGGRKVKELKVVPAADAKRRKAG
jgi:hypothetical protein